MTDTQLTIIIAGIPAVLTALGALIAAVIVSMGRKIDVGTAISAANSQSIAEVKSKADVIEGHVNSAATSAAAKIDSLQSEVIELKKVLSENKEIAALLAQSTASKSEKPSEPAEMIVVNKEPLDVAVVQTKKESK